MSASNLVILLVLLLSTPIHAIRANNVIIRSATGAPSFNHDGYVAQMIESGHEPSFMHEQWHNRHVEVAGANETTASTAPTGHVNSTGLYDHGEKASDTVPALAMTDTTIDTDEWDELTEQLCITSLSDIHDIATNPSGIESCYNILNFDIKSGTFDADLRIFQISLPREGWQGMKSNSLRLGLNYAHAEVSKTTSNSHTKAKRSVDEGRQEWRAQDHGQANDWLRLRSSRVEPKRVGVLRLTGIIDEAGKAKSNASEEAAKGVLTPQIQISAMDAIGKPLSIDLGLQAAWFINGVFAQPVNNLTKMDEWELVIDIESILARGSKLQGTQLIPIIVACVWAVLVSLPWAYCLWLRIKMQREYRSKMEKGYRLNVTVISWE